MLVLRVWFGLCLGKHALLQPRGILCSGCTDGPAHPHAAQFLLLLCLNDRYYFGVLALILSMVVCLAHSPYLRFHTSVYLFALGQRHLVNNHFGTAGKTFF